MPKLVPSDNNVHAFAVRAVRSRSNQILGLCADGLAWSAVGKHQQPTELFLNCDASFSREARQQSQSFAALEKILTTSIDQLSDQGTKSVHLIFLRNTIDEN